MQFLNKKTSNNEYMSKCLINVTIFTLIYVVTYILYQRCSTMLAGTVFIACGILYFVFNFKKFFFHSTYILIWTATMGLAMLRLLEYQVMWSNKFFIIMYLGMITFYIGLSFGNIIMVTKEKKNIERDINTIKFNEKLKRRVCFTVNVASFIAILCFVISTIKTGIIAIFASGTSSYIDRYTKFVVFEIAMSSAPALAYYSISNFNLKKRERLNMYFSILLHIIILPILNVSRGNMMTAVAMFLPSFLYFFIRNNNISYKKLIRMSIIGFVFIIIAYSIISSGRNYSNDYLNYVFQPKEINFLGMQFKLDGGMSFLYGYLTVSFDNFNHNLQTFTNYSFGGRLLSPFNVILNIDYLDELVNNSKLTNISLGLNTHNMFAWYYYDLGIAGILLYTLVHSTFYGIIERYFRDYETPIGSIVYGLAFMNILLGFFTSWIMKFEWWMWLGTSMIFYIFTYARIKVRRYVGGNE